MVAELSEFWHYHPVFFVLLTCCFGSYLYWLGAAIFGDYQETRGLMFLLLPFAPFLLLVELISKLLR